MFKTIIHRPMARRILRNTTNHTSTNNRHNFSVLSIHTTFPATLHRFQLKPESQLYDKKLQREEDEVDDAVDVAQDGLVYPGVSDLVSNGALFMPNTNVMQQLTRMSLDYYFENREEREPFLEPLYLSIPKGTPIPSTLTLLRERNLRTRFWLQPAEAMSLHDLNNALSGFYLKCGIVVPAGKWLEAHDYHEAFDDAKEDWMLH